MVGTRLGDLWILDLITLNWSSPQLYGIPPLPRSLHTANIVDNRYFLSEYNFNILIIFRMYVFGGWVPVNNGSKSFDLEKEWQCTNSLGIFNVETMTWEYLSETTLDGKFLFLELIAFCFNSHL